MTPAAFTTAMLYLDRGANEILNAKTRVVSNPPLATLNTK
jgi:hypothetical protein